MTAMRRGWLHLASGAGIGRMFGFVSNLLLSRWLGPADLGLFNLVTTTVQTGDTIVRCGGDYALNFELGGQPEVMDRESAAHLARALSQLCTLTTALFCIGTAIWVCSGQGLFPVDLTANHRFSLTILLLLMIACEGTSASAWEVLLVSQRTGYFALRQGLFFPLRLLSAAACSLYAGVLGAMAGWTFIAFLQCLWLKRTLGDLWKPLTLWPLLASSLTTLLKRGLPFYGANLLASIIFYPLLLKLASGSGLAEIGYLRAGQILQQLFAFFPATLVPVLFLKLRSESTFAKQVISLEKPLRMIWFLLLEFLLLYCMFEQTIIVWLFGPDFSSASLPTRLLLITALFECLSQLAVQPLLAAGYTRVYGLWQNGAAVSSAILGWLWIPKAGIAAYLIVRLLYYIIPLIGFGLPMVQLLKNPQKILLLTLASASLLLISLFQAINDQAFSSAPTLYVITFFLVGFYQRHDLFSLHHALRSRT